MNSKKIYQYLNNNFWEFALVLFLIFLGIFLRTYNFSNWLHFEIDQSYDFLMVSPSVEKGISNLPLLGPTAGGGRALRLGPAFYYMEYTSAKIFGNNPTGHAMSVLILSILALPLFYVFCRRYFSVKLSIGLLTIFSVSLYLVLYSRFSWSPNVLPFLILLSFYALLRSVGKNEKNREGWFLIFAFVIGITTQIHFNAFFTIPAVAIVFLLIKRPKFKLKTWILAIMIFFVLYSPVIFNEIRTKGQNLHYFESKIPIKSNGEIAQAPAKENKSIGEKIFQDFRYNAYEYFLIISGVDVINNSRPKGYSLGIICESCNQERPWRIAGIVFFILGTSSLLYRLLKEEDKEKKDFLMVLALWLVISFIYFFSITYDGLYIYPRFFLIIAPLPIVFLGLIFENIQPEKKKISLLVFAVVILLLASLNLRKIKDDFNQLKNAPYQDEKIENEDIFPNNYRVTQEQQLLIADYIESKFKQNNYPVYIKTIHEYEPTFWYYLGKNGIYYYAEMKPEVAYKQGNYFIILYKSSDNSKELDQYSQKFSITDKKEFGSLIAYYLSPNPEFISAERQSDSDKKTPIQVKQISEILTWKKLFSSK